MMKEEEEEEEKRIILINFPFKFLFHFLRFRYPDFNVMLTAGSWWNKIRWIIRGFSRPTPVKKGGMAVHGSPLLAL